MSQESAIAEPRWLDAREQAAWRAFLDMHTRLNARLNREMQDECGMSIADFSVLVQLSEHEGSRMRVLELARSLRWEKSRLSHQLTRMGQRGLIERSNCSEDRRGAFVVLTDAGREAVEAAAPRHVESVRRYLFDGLTGEQVDALAAISGGVISRLDDVCGEQVDACDAVADPGATAADSCD
jgi:DNA-binding MarR family transcriptional regulator